MTRVRDARPWLLGITALVVLLDRLTKLWVLDHIRLGYGRVVIPKVFRITHVLNTGAAFSMFANADNQQHVRWGLIIFSIAAGLLMLALIIKLGRRFTLSTIAFALVLGGALGNLYDRVKTGEVIDFIEVHIGSYHYPDFNIADSAIVIGGILIFGDAIRPQPKRNTESAV